MKFSSPGRERVSNPRWGQSFFSKYVTLACFAIATGLLVFAGCSEDQQKALVEATKKAAEQTSDAVSDAAEKTKQRVSDLADDASELASDANAAAKSAVDSLSDAASDALEQAPEVFQDPGALQDAVSQLAESVMPSPGTATISIDETYEFRDAFVRVIPVTDESGAISHRILQIRSYQSIEEERFPSFLFQAEVPSEELPTLASQDLPGQLFVQPAADAPVWSCEVGSAVTARITAQDANGNWTGSFVQGRLSSSIGGDVQMRGDFSAVPLKEDQAPVKPNRTSATVGNEQVERLVKK